MRLRKHQIKEQKNMIGMFKSNANHWRTYKHQQERHCQNMPGGYNTQSNILPSTQNNQNILIYLETLRFGANGMGHTLAYFETIILSKQLNWFKPIKQPVCIILFAFRVFWLIRGQMHMRVSGVSDLCIEETKQTIRHLYRNILIDS